MDPQHGLLWDQSFWGVTPAWATEPNIKAMIEIERKSLAIPELTRCDVEFLAEGTFNKVYNVRCGLDEEYIMRVTLPVQPRFKTMSEVATINVIRHHTDISVPKGLQYDVSNDNELGFEWMVMERVRGLELEERWKDMSWVKKRALGM